MNNETTGPMLQLPAVPADFNGGVGVEFAQELLKLLSSTRVVGLPTDLAQTFDFVQVQQKISELEDSVASNTRKFRHVVMTGVTDAEFYVPFADMGTTQYAAWGVPIIETGENPSTAITVCVIEGTKANNQCKFRIDGAGATYNFEFFFLEYKQTD